MSSKILLKESDIDIAKSLCEQIENLNIKSKAIIQAIAMQALTQDLGNKDVDFDSGIYVIEKIQNDIEISDIYIDNNYFDVRVHFNDHDICIPKAHFDNDILPEAYVFVKISKDLSEASVSGFIKPENVSFDNVLGEYYFIQENDLVSYSEVEPTELKFSEDILSDEFKLDAFNYIDEKLSQIQKIEFYKKLLSTREGRIYLKDIIKTKNAFDLSLNETDTDFEENTVSLTQQIDEGALSETFEINITSEVESELDNIYSTSTTPSLETIEDSFEEAEKFEEEPLVITEEQDNELKIIEEGVSDDISPDVSQEENEEEIASNNENISQIDDLFVQSENTPENINEDLDIQKNKARLKLPVFGLILLLGGLGYFGYTKINQTNSVQPTKTYSKVATAPQKEIKKEVAMPIETVENIETIKSKDEAIAITIPEIEKNLDASILVSNLTVGWEIPASKINNNGVNNYLTKLGKIVQLNLKTELLLLNKPPIANKIVLDLSFNQKTKMVTVNGIKDSSGEKSIDDLIIQTVKKVFDMNIKASSAVYNAMPDSFALIIRL